MYVYRLTENGPEFFVQDHHDGYKTVLSGHVGDIHPNETLADAAERETKEELDVTPLEVTKIGHTETVELPKWNKLSTEHAFLIEIPNEDVQYLNGEEKHIWVKPENLESTLTFDHQKRAAAVAVSTFIL